MPSSQRRVTVREGVGFPDNSRCSTPVEYGLTDCTTVESILLSLSFPKDVVERNLFCLAGCQSHKRLHPSVPILEQIEARGIEDTCFDILPVVRGGGGDGGSTGAEDRAAYLAMYAGKKPDKVDPAEQRLALYTTCRLSGEPLRPPCVCDDLGSLYNKDAVLMALISKAIPKSLVHLTSRKSVHDVVLYPAEGADPRVRFGCPITGLSMSGRYRFVAVKSTVDERWHILSEKAVKELPVVVQGKIGCALPDTKGMLPIYPQGDELNDLLDSVMSKHREELVEKAAKKAKKEKKKRQREENDNNGMNDKAAVDPHKKPASIQQNIPDGATPAVWKSLFVDKKNKVPEGDAGYMTRGVRKYI